uniref:Uncharacterized protein n=1 Tax=Physcomitrium patens TaxID=3218 RepID=A0A7I4C480_PHYPA
MTSLVLYCSQIGILLPGSEGGYVIAEATAPVAGPSSAGRGKVSPESAEIKGVKKADLKVASRANTDNEGGARANDGRGHFSKFGGRVDADQDYNEKLRTTWTIKSLGSTSTQSILRCNDSVRVLPTFWIFRLPTCDLKQLRQSVSGRVVMAKEMKLGLTSYSPS